MTRVDLTPELTAIRIPARDLREGDQMITDGGKRREITKLWHSNAAHVVAGRWVSVEFVQASVEGNTVPQGWELTEMVTVARLVTEQVEQAEPVPAGPVGMSDSDARRLHELTGRPAWTWDSITRRVELDEVETGVRVSEWDPPGGPTAKTLAAGARQRRRLRIADEWARCR